MADLNIGLTGEARLGIVETLNKLLADEHILYVKTRNYHWNVSGPRFHPLHLFFEDQYTQLEAIIDDVAENARQFGGFARASLSDFLRLARLKETPGLLPDEDGMIADLLADHESVIRQLRLDVDAAAGTYAAADAADFLTGLLEKHNKMAWMLRSHLSR